MKELTTQKLRHYALQQKLSHKAGRRTFLARDLYTKTPVIVKILQLGEAFEWDALKLFKREGQILEHLEHYTIPQYKDSFETEIDGVHSFVLVQTYIPAPSLQKVVEEGKLFSEAETIAIAQQLLTTLSYLHQQLPPVIHRDLKPSNILISEPSPRAIANAAGVIERNVYLVDFGAVQIAASKSSGTVTIVGSYGYMPLEQFLGQTTPASDLYSLGMTLLYLLTGMHPSELPQVDGHLSIERLGEIVGLSDWFTRWLSQMIEPYADQRFESAAIALTALSHKNDDSGYFPHLRPDPHHLRIYRQQNELKIVSKQAITNINWGCIFCLSVPPLLMLAASLLALAGSFLGPLGVITMAIAFIGILLFLVFTKNQSAINRYELISISRTLGIRMGTTKGQSLSHSSVKWSNTISPFQSIRLLTYNPGYAFERYYNKKERTSVPTSIVIPPKLSIHAGKHEYSIQCSELSEAEQHWLDKELNDFLGLSLQKLNPTDANRASALRKTRRENLTNSDSFFLM